MTRPADAPLPALCLPDALQPHAFIEKQGRVHCFEGSAHFLEKLDDIHALAVRYNTDVVFALPFCAIRERGFDARGDEPIRALAVARETVTGIDDFIAALPDAPVALAEGITATPGDDDYAAMVARFQVEAIEAGHVSQATLARVFETRIADYGADTLRAIYRRLLKRRGQYMTVLLSMGAADTALVGATPERHLTVHGNETRMVPIAGTLRKEDRATFPARLAAFIEDRKEINELFQVMDEEMKMMGLICPEGGAVTGPYLRETGSVIHTEYHLTGKRGVGTLQSLRQTLFAPTVVGSPMESAARQIAAFEGVSRRYYAGVIGIYRKPEDSGRAEGDIDTGILIRCAEIDNAGCVRVQAGGGLVRDSDPVYETQESRAKAMGILSVLMNDGTHDDPFLTPDLAASIAPTLAARNNDLSPFWVAQQNPYLGIGFDLKGKRVVIINNEDDFACMIGHMLTNFKADVRVVDTFDFDMAGAADLIVIGPGPGDPNDTANPRMEKLRAHIRAIKQAGVPHLGVCLGHQMLALHDGIAVQRQARSSQGMPRRVRVDGGDHLLGFYNSFSPVYRSDLRERALYAYDCDEEGRIIVMRGPAMAGFQFHPESVMSQTGYALLYQAAARLLGMEAETEASS